MCVILSAYRDRPTENMIRAAFDQNSHGAGFAWRDGPKTVRYKKDLDVEEAVELAATLPIPYVAHFRIASCGPICGELTHPFPITPASELASEGRAPSVLFHNGHWNNWKVNLVDCALRTGGRLPAKEPWSDSRAMAYIAARTGLGLLDLIDEKVAVLTPTNLYIFGSSGRTGWTNVKGVYCSNDYFDSKMFALDRKGDPPLVQGSRGTNSTSGTHSGSHNGIETIEAVEVDEAGSANGRPVSGFPRLLGPDRGGHSSTDSGASRGAVPFGDAVTFSQKALRKLRTRMNKQERAEQREFERLMQASLQAEATASPVSH